MRDVRTLLDLRSACPNVSRQDLAGLRRALLQIDREETRARGQRALERFVEARHPFLSPIAQGGLASCAYWSGNMNAAIYWARMAVGTYPMTPSAMWCATLLVSLYRMLGMKKERFEAEGDRLRIMKRIALQSDHPQDRILALYELRRELEARDMEADAERCLDELHDLMNWAGLQTPAIID